MRFQFQPKWLLCVFAIRFRSCILLFRSVCHLFFICLFVVKYVIMSMCLIESRFSIIYKQNNIRVSVPFNFYYFILH